MNNGEGATHLSGLRSGRVKASRRLVHSIDLKVEDIRATLEELFEEYTILKKKVELLESTNQSGEKKPKGKKDAKKEHEAN